MFVIWKSHSFSILSNTCTQLLFQGWGWVCTNKSRGSGMNPFMENIFAKHWVQFRCSDPGSKMKFHQVQG